MSEGSEHGKWHPSFLIGLGCLIALALLGRIAPEWPRSTTGIAPDGHKSSLEKSALPHDDSGAADAVHQQLVTIKQRENEEWPEGEIRRNPISYLEHCRELMSSLREDLLDMQFGTRVERSRFLRLAEEERSKISANCLFLVEAEKKVLENAPFPVSIDGFSFDGEAFSNAVRNADADITRSEKALAAHTAGAERAENLLGVLGETLSELSREISENHLEIDALRANEARKAAEEAKSRIGQLLDGTREISRTVKTRHSAAQEKSEQSLSVIFNRNHKRRDSGL